MKVRRLVILKGYDAGCTFHLRGRWSATILTGQQYCGGSMKQGRRAVLGMALLGGVGHVLGAAPPSKPAGTPLSAADPLDAELAAVAAAPACQLASLSVLAIRDGKVAYECQSGQRFIAAGGMPSKPANERTLYRIASISKMMTTLGPDAAGRAGQAGARRRRQQLPRLSAAQSALPGRAGDAARAAEPYLDPARRRAAIPSRPNSR